MKKWIMLEIAVKVDTDLESVDEIVDNLDIKGNDVCDVCDTSIENFYEFDC